MLEGEMLAGEVYKKCKGWHVWEQVCDLMASCLSTRLTNTFQVERGDEFLHFLEKQFPDKKHQVWANVNIYTVHKLNKVVYDGEAYSRPG